MQVWLIAFSLLLISDLTQVHAGMISRLFVSSTCFATPRSQRYYRQFQLHRLFSVHPPRRRIRAISCDVTGTLVSFQGKIEDHYGNAARACGIEFPTEQAALLPKMFQKAYKETCAAHPCFGNSTISSKEWWRQCVRRSFNLVGTSMTEPEQERVFQRVYSAFGGHSAYAAFPDAIPFLNWCHRRGIACGVISNADERYGDSILPMLGLREAMQFLTFSKNVGHEKPNQKIFEAALREAEPWLCLGKADALEADPLKPEEILHIGNDYQKDFVGATEAGFHAVLLDRFDEIDVAAEWRANGARVYKDLIDVVEFLGREQFELGSRECCSNPEHCFDI
jgi:putative hydrolase of the HAD superfamily